MSAGEVVLSVFVGVCAAIVFGKGVEGDKHLCSSSVEQTVLQVDTTRKQSYVGKDEHGVLQVKQQWPLIALPVHPLNRK